MSRTIDEKVVEMRFDNRNFERNVAQSMSTLDKLKSALDFSGAEKAFSGITSAAHKLDFGPLGGAIDGVGQKFSALETMAVGALMNIGATIESKLVNTLKSVSIDQVTAGWDKYAEKTTSVQTIMNATGKEIDEVSKKLATLNWFTDETSYNFTDMTSSIGKFTSQGIDLDRSVVAMEGISTAAALAGQNAASASRVMYNFSQALGMGAVKLQDWMSVENAQMATEEFKQTIIDTAIELGRLDMYGNIRETKYALDELGRIQYDELGNIIEEAQLTPDQYAGPAFANIKNFRNTLAAGWFDDKVLIAAMEKFGGFSNRLNQVYEQFNENYDVTTSQILTWLNEYMDGTFHIEDAVKKTGLAAEEILPILEELSSDEYALGRRAFAAAQEAKTFEDVVNATADAVSTSWMNVFEKIFGNYEEARVTWTQLSNELWDIFAGPISNLNDLLTDWHDMGGRDDFIQSVKNMYYAVRSFLDPIGEAWDSVFPPKTADDIYNFTKRLKEFSESLILDETRVDQIRMVFEDFFGIFKTFSTAFRDGGGFGKFVEGIGGILKGGTDRIYDFMLSVQRVRSAMESLKNGSIADFGEFQRIMEENSGAAKFLDIYEKILKTVETLGQTFGRLLDTTEFLKDGALTFDSVIDGIRTKMVTILRAVSDIIHLWTGRDITSITDSIRKIIFDLSDGLKVLVGHEGWGRVKDGILDVGAAIKETFGPAWKAAMTIFSDWLKGIGMILGGTNADLDGFFDTIVNGLGHIADFIRSGKGAVEFISDFLVKFLSLTDAINTYQENGGGILGILSVVHEKLKLILDTIADLIQNVTGFDAHGIGNSILSVIEGIGYAILQVANTVSKAFGWKDNPFGKLLGTLGPGPEGEGLDLSGVFNKVADAFLRFSDLVDKVAPGVAVLLRTVGDAFKNLWEFIGQIRLEDLIRIFQALASIGLIMEAKKALSVLGDTLEAYQKKLKADMLFAIAGAILAIAGAAFLISKIDTEKIGLVLGTLGIAFAGIIGTLFISKFANAKSLAALPGSILAIATAMVILAKAAKLMAEPIQMFADMKDFWAGMARLGTVMGSFGALLGILGALNKSGAVNGAAKALGKLAGVLTLMLPLVLVYSTIDFWKLAEGLGKMVGPVVLLGGSLILLSKFASNAGDVSGALIKFAGALAIMAGVMFIMNRLDGEAFRSSLGKLAVGLLALTAGIAAFSFSLAIISPVLGLLDKFATSLLKLGTAILFISAGVGLLGIVATILGDSAQTIADAGVNLIVTVLDAIVARTPEIAEDIVLFIVGVLQAVADHTPEIVAIAVQILGGIMQGIHDAMSEGGVNLGDFLAGSGILAGLIGLVWLLKKMKLNIGDFGNAALALAGAAVLLTEIGAIFWALGELSAKVGGAEGIKQFGEFCSAIVDVFREDGGVGLLFASLFGLLVLMGTLSAKAGLKSSNMAGGLADAFGSITLIITEVTEIMDVIGLLFAASGGAVAGLDWLIEKFGGPEGGVVKAIEAFGEMAIAIADVIGGVIGHLVGSAVGGIAGGTVEGVMKGYADGLAYIADTADNFFSLMDGLKPTTLKGCKLFGEMIMELTKADILDGLTSWFTGGVDYKKFADGLADLAPSIAAFAEQTKDIKQGDVEKAAACAEIITAFAKEVPNSGGLIGLIAGNNDLDDFAAGISALGPSLNSFATATTDLDKDAVEQAVACAEMITAFARDIPNSGGLIAVLTGDNDIATFASNLPIFAYGLVEFAKIIGGNGHKLSNGELISLPKLDAEAVTSSSEAITAIIEMTKSIPTENKGWKWFTEGDNSIKTFGESLTSFGTSLVSYSQTLASEDFKLTTVKNTTAAIEAIIAMAEKIAGKGIEKLDDFGSNLKSFGSSFKSYYSSVKDVDSSKASKIATAINDTIAAFMGSSNTSLASKVATLTTEFLDKLVATFSGDSSKKKSEEAADKFVDFFKERFKNVTSISKVNVAITEMVTKAVGDPELKEGLKQAGIAMVTEIGTGFSGAVDEEKTGLKQTVVDKLNGVARMISNRETTDLFATKGGDLISGIRRGMFPDAGISQSFKDAIVQFGIDVSNLFAEQVGSFQNAGKILAGGVITGMTGTNLINEASTYAKNVTDGFANSMRQNASVVEKAVQETIVDTTKKTVTAPMKGNAGKSGGLSINSPSLWGAMASNYVVQGFVNHFYDSVPKVKEAVQAFVSAAKEGLDYNGLIAKAKELGFDMDGSFVDKVQDYISNGLSDFTLDADPEMFLDNILGSLESGDIFSGAGENWANEITGSFTSALQEYANSGIVPDTVSMVTEDMSDVFGGYTATSYDLGYEGGYSWGDGLSNGIVDSVGGAETTIMSACDRLENTTSEKMESVMTNVLSYADWLAKEYPDGVTIPTPVLEFDDLKMQAGEMEALMTSFDMMSDFDKEMLIRHYGADLRDEATANFLKRYWNAQPIYEENRQRQADALAGYQMYLDEQRALAEAQTIQQQEAYTGIQAIATDMNESQKASDEKVNLALEEIKMHVASIREELDGVHADINRLNEMDVYIDSDTLVGATAEKYDQALGNMAKIGRRGI